MVRALMKVFGNRLALVGMSRNDGPRTGRWVHKEILGQRFPFLSVATSEPSGRRPLVPARLTFYRGLCRYKGTILASGCKAALIQAPEALLAVSGWQQWESLCFWFPGVENQLKASRYAFARPFSQLFDRALFSALDRVSVILAAADEGAIKGLVARSRGRLKRERLVQFPTSVDTSLFHPVPGPIVRAELEIPADRTLFVTVGRIGRLKGWPFLLDAFEQYCKTDRNALLYFVGDGEDGPPLQTDIENRGLTGQVKVTGFQKPAQVAAYLNAANVIVSGSLLEGWSVAMLEALACGKPIVSTEVSGASGMIRPGQNGFIIRDRNPIAFAQAMQEALYLKDAEQVSMSIADGFDLTHLRDRLASAWSPLGGAADMSKTAVAAGN